MDALAKILSSRARSEIFRILFGPKGVEFHNREIERRSGLSESNVRRELRNLESLDLVRSRRDGNRVYYRANEEHPLYREVHNMALKTSGLGDVLQQALARAEIQVAFVFGSIASGEEKAGSDIDLMVIGEIGLRGVTDLLSGVADRVGREINPHVLTAAAFRKRSAVGEQFLRRVLKSPKIFVRGTERELAELGG